jgi:hypothetical protein
VELSSRFSAAGIGDLQVLSGDGGLAFCRGWRDTAEGNGGSVLVVLPVSEQPTLAESIFHYVMRTRQSMILDDALAGNPFSADEYICRKANATADAQPSLGRDSETPTLISVSVARPVTG